MLILARLIVAGLSLYVLLLVLVAVTAIWQAREHAVPNADVILVLGAGMDPDGRIHSPGVARVEKGVELWMEGVAPKILFSGGPAVAGGVDAAEGMAEIARSHGVPEEAILYERGSWSTLHNALMSRPLVGEGRVILVTHGYHMARSRITAAWAGLNVVGYACPEAFSVTTRGSVRAVTREGMAIPFNLARATLWHILGWAGYSEAERMPMLARAPGEPERQTRG